MKGGAFEWDKNGFRTERYTLKPLNNWQSTIWIRMAERMVKESTVWRSKVCQMGKTATRSDDRQERDGLCSDVCVCEWCAWVQQAATHCRLHAHQRECKSSIPTNLVVSRKTWLLQLVISYIIYLIHPGSWHFQLTVTHKTSFFKLFLYPEFGLNFTLFY